MSTQQSVWIYLKLANFDFLDIAYEEIGKEVG